MDNGAVYPFSEKNQQEDKQMWKIVLASGSPRRREILAGIGVKFTVLATDTDETCSISDPGSYAEELARRKGQAAWNQLLRQEKGNEENLSDVAVLSADTVVAIDKEILGKPKDREDALRMLHSLSGRTHRVITGIGVTIRGVTYTTNCQTSVHVAAVPAKELEEYADSGDPMDKAGAYGIQGAFSRWVEGIDGCYFNVVGLPVHACNQLFYDVTGQYLK